MDVFRMYEGLAAVTIKFKQLKTCQNGKVRIYSIQIASNYSDSKYLAGVEGVGHSILKHQFVERQLRQAAILSLDGLSLSSFPMTLQVGFSSRRSSAFVIDPSCRWLRKRAPAAEPPKASSVAGPSRVGDS